MAFSLLLNQSGIPPMNKNRLNFVVIGVWPVEAGYQTWLVEPQPGDLNWAEGTVPTPTARLGSHGIETRWVASASGSGCPTAR